MACVSGHKRLQFLAIKSDAKNYVHAHSHEIATSRRPMFIVTSSGGDGVLASTWCHLDY